MFSVVFFLFLFFKISSENISACDGPVWHQICFIKIIKKTYIKIKWVFFFFILSEKIHDYFHLHYLFFFRIFLCFELTIPQTHWFFVLDFKMLCKSPFDLIAWNFQNIFFLKMAIASFLWFKWMQIKKNY